MRSHFSLDQRVAAACAVAGAATLLTGNCAAQNFLAADFATNATYAAGWSAGQNGGYGFGPWSFTGTEDTAPNEQAMDRGASPYNPFGVAWTLYNPDGTPPGPTSPGYGCVNPPIRTDISRAGRLLPNGELKPGQTFSTVVANPSCHSYYRGYTIILSTGSDNILYGSVGSQVSAGTFDYFMEGYWYTTATFQTGYTPLSVEDTTTNGVQIDITLTSTNTYHLVMTPVGNPERTYSEDGTLENNKLTGGQGAVNWVTYQLYNTDSNF